MEMWHNGEQASGATIAVGATKLRAAAQPARVSSHLPRLPYSPLLPSPLLSSPLAHSLIPLPLTSRDKNVMFEQEF